MGSKQEDTIEHRAPADVVPSQGGCSFPDQLGVEGGGVLMRAGLEPGSAGAATNLGSAPVCGWQPDHLHLNLLDLQEDITRAWISAAQRRHMPV